MAPAQLAIHIPPEANPSNIIQLLDLLADNVAKPFPTVRDLLDFVDAAGISSRTEIQSIATDLGLLSRSEDGISLSRAGQVFVKIKENVQYDILHYLFYAGWDKSTPLKFLPSWTYRMSCNHYWRSNPLKLDDDYLNQRVVETINEAEQTFQELGFSDFTGVSFSRKSISGLHKWLECLNPPVIDNSDFSRRAFCPPELLLLSLGYVLRDEDAVTQTDVLLSREKREAVCQICLLEPITFDRALDWMMPIYPRVISPGTAAGFYGRFIRLHKIPMLEDVIR